MKDIWYVILNFFTHKDFLVDAKYIPGTLGTPLHKAAVVVYTIIIIWSAVYVSKHKEKIIPSFKWMWIILVVWEVLRFYYDCCAGEYDHWALRDGLPLYPCSLYLYVMPFVIWGNEFWKKVAYGYLLTLGMLGAVTNFYFTSIVLKYYSVISFVGLHTYVFHGALMYTFLVLLMSGMANYRNVKHVYELFIPSIASLLLSIPANLVNYSKIDADYMFFRGRFPILPKLFPFADNRQMLMIVYVLYIIIPMAFYLPSFLCNRYAMRHHSCLEDSMEVQ